MEINSYRGVPHWTVSFGHWLTHIRVQHLVLSSTKLEFNTWSRVEPNKTATLQMLNYIKVLQSNVVERFDSNPKPGAAL